MLDSAINILNQYLDAPISHFAIKRLTIMGIDVAEYLYLCETRNAAYVVFETDFIFSLPRTAEDAAEIFQELTLTGWLVKKAHQKKYGELQQFTADVEDNPGLYNALISNEADLRQAVILVESKRK